MNKIESSSAVLPSRASLRNIQQLFQKLFSPEGIQRLILLTGGRFYDRIFSVPITLWYLIFQRLQSDQSQAAVLVNLRQGGADALFEQYRQKSRAQRRRRAHQKQKLSQRMRSVQSNAYNQARRRMPWQLVRRAFGLVSQWSQGATVQQAQRPVQVFDGSTLALPPHGDMAQEFGAAQNQHGNSYWCLMRVVVGFCARSGAVLSAALGSYWTSEQALAWELMAQAVVGTIFVGDSNFGVWSVVERAQHYGHDVVVRLTQARAHKLLGGEQLRSGQERLVQWEPSARDQAAPGAQRRGVCGRVLYIELRRRGFRVIRLWLFTTLSDAVAYPVERLVQWYGLRWHAELNLRYLKTQMRLAVLSVKSAAMAKKEFYAGLIAYNLLRLLMDQAAQRRGQSALELSFSNCRREILGALARLLSQPELWKAKAYRRFWEELLDQLVCYRLPKRKKPRLSEPRRVRYRNRTFPPLVGDRHVLRKKLRKEATKSTGH